MKSLPIYLESKRLQKSIEKQLEHLVKISKILEKGNQVEFFKNTSVIFEKLFQKYYEGSKNDSYSKQRKWLFERLKKHYPALIIYLDAISKNLDLLNKYRNKIIHELDSNDNIEVLKENLIINFKKLYKDMLILDGEIENKFEVLLREDKLLSSKQMEIIKSHIKEDRTKIDTYDIQLYIIILTIYSSLCGMLTGAVVGEIEALENICYTLESDEPISNQCLDEVEIYSQHNYLFLKQQDNKKYKLKLQTTSSPEYWQSLLVIFKRKHKVRLHQKDKAFSMEFLEDFIGMN